MLRIKCEICTLNRYENNIFKQSRTYQGGVNRGLMTKKKNKGGSGEKDEHIKEEDKRLETRG